MLDPLGDVFTLVGLASVTLAALKWLGVLALVGADPVTVALLVVGLVLIVLGLTRRFAANRPDETPPPTKAPPLTLDDAPPPDASLYRPSPVTVPPEAVRPDPSPADPNMVRALMRGRGDPTRPGDDTDLYRRASEEAAQLQERWEESDRRKWREALGRRLQRGLDLLQGLRHTPAELAAAMEPEVAECLIESRDTLSAHPDLEARFNHAIASVVPDLPDHPRIQKQAILGTGPARQRLESILVKGTDCLAEFLREAP